MPTPAEYDDTVMEQIEQHAAESGKGKGGAYPAGEGPGEEKDELFDAGVDVVLDLGQASASMLQRRLKLGYARAARLLDQMEQQGIVGPSEGAKPRQILITKEQWAQMQAGGGDAPVEEVPPAVEDEILTLPGQSRAGDSDEFYVDDEGVKALLIDVFYEKA